MKCREILLCDVIPIYTHQAFCQTWPSHGVIDNMASHEYGPRNSVFFQCGGSRFVKKIFFLNKSILLSRFIQLIIGHDVSPSDLKILLKSVLFHKCCRNLCVSVSRCVHDTFQWFGLFMNHMSRMSDGWLIRQKNPN
jgi:hypothetical protein